jgi:hypothetical protein
MQLVASQCVAARGRSRRRGPARRVSAIASPQRAPPAPLQSTPAWASRFQHNPALAGNFAPVEHEVFLPSLRVDGTLPPSVDGVFLRNGPNPRFPPDVGGYHWFGACRSRRRSGPTRRTALRRRLVACVVACGSVLLLVAHA